MSPKGERFLLVIMIALLIVAVLFMFSGCQSVGYQPPGHDLWLAVP
jgi:hypothetical protein